jgi:hypothetical protein
MIMCQNRQRKTFKTIFWNIQDQKILNTDISLLKVPVQDTEYRAYLKARTNFTVEKNIDINLNFKVKKFDYVDETFVEEIKVSASCWIGLQDGGCSKFKKRNLQVGVNKDKRGSTRIETDHFFAFENQELEFIDEERENTFDIASLNFELDFVLIYKGSTDFMHCQRIYLTKIEALCKSFQFLDVQIKRIKDNLSDSESLVKLQTSPAEEDSISIPLSLLVHFSPMMKCMLIGNGNAESQMMEANSFEVCIDPKFNRNHLKIFHILIFGPEDSRYAFLSKTELEVFLEMFEFLDIYGFDAWKPVILKRISELFPRYDHLDLIKYLHWKSKTNEPLDLNLF